MTDEVLPLTGVRRQIEAVDADMSGSTFTDVSLAGAIFNDINLTGARIRDGNLSNLTIADCRIDGMTIDGVAVSDLLQAYANSRTKRV